MALPSSSVRRGKGAPRSTHVMQFTFLVASEATMNRSIAAIFGAWFRMNIEGTLCNRPQCARNRLASLTSGRSVSALVLSATSCR